MAESRGGVVWRSWALKMLATSPRDDPFPGLAVLCSEYQSFVHGFDDFAAMRLLGRALAPHSQGFAEAWTGVLGCLRWPLPAANPPHRVSIRREAMQACLRLLEAESHAAT